MNQNDREAELRKALLDIGGKCTAAPPDEHARLTLMLVYGPRCVEPRPGHLQIVGDNAMPPEQAERLRRSASNAA